MTALTFAHARTLRPLRQIALASALACLPLSGLSASAGAETTLVESLAPSAAITPQPVLEAGVPALPAERAISGGSASYYAAKFEGRPTASGERYRADELTAAHRSLPFGSKVRVTNPATGKSVTVRINDRGPFTAGRVIDVSRAAAEELGLIARGHAPVELAVIED